MAKYFTIDGYTTAAGLTHQKSSLECLLNAAYQRHAIPLIPTFRLAAHHNHGLELMSDLSTYFDYDRLTINGNKCRVAFTANSTIPEAEIERVTVDHDAVEAVEGVLCELREFRDVHRNDIVLPHQDKIVRTAQEIAQRLQPYTCIHVRRGDRVSDVLHDTELSCANILDKIKSCGLTTAYIMTNEDRSYFDPLRSTPFNVVFSSDFSELNNIEDNYLLFCIENEIMERAARRVSTFRVLFDAKKDYYDFHLSEAIGWQ